MGKFPHLFSSQKEKESFIMTVMILLKTKNPILENEQKKRNEFYIYTIYRLKMIDIL